MLSLAEYRNGCRLWEAASADYAGVLAQRAAALLAQGHLFVLRSVPELVRLRDGLVAYAASRNAAAGRGLADFYASARIPEPEILVSLVQALKAARETRWVSQQLASWLRGLKFDPAVLLDCGINRLVLPPAAMSAARASGLFDRTDFARERADGPVETFMAQPSNIHRDFNREHSVLMCNLWFPLHDLDAEETVTIFPEAYRREVYDMENTAENRRRLGAPLEVALRFGDALLFHGEHLHCSPTVRSGARRHSFDLRIASRCPDDNAHYRDNFWNLNNFLTARGTASVNLDSPYSVERPLRRHHEAHGDSLPANYYCIAVERNADFADWNDLLEIFESYPFAEDRYLWAARLAQARGASASTGFARKVGERSSEFFWVMRAARFLECAADSHARFAWQRALALAEALDSLPNLAPVRYQNPTNQCSPAEARQIAIRKLTEHSLHKSIWRRMCHVFRNS